MDLTSLALFTTAPFIEQLVQYLKVQWKLPTRLAPLAALLVGVFGNVGYNVYLANINGVGTDYLTSVLVGLGIGFSTSVWHEITKEPQV